MTVLRHRSASLAAFQKRWRALKGTSYEPAEVLYEIPLVVLLGPRQPRRLFLVTKQTLLSRIYEETQAFPPHWVIVQRHGLPDQAHVEEVGSISRRLKLPICFIGDLAPFDLHVFIRYHDMAKTTVARPSWWGINARWLQLCRRLAGPEQFDMSVAQDMSPVEREHFAALQVSAPWLEGALGAEPWNLLREGKKVSLEAASGVAFYGEGFHRRLVRLLEGRTTSRPSARSRKD